MRPASIGPVKSILRRVDLEELYEVIDGVLTALMADRHAWRIVEAVEPVLAQGHLPVRSASISVPTQARLVNGCREASVPGSVRTPVREIIPTSDVADCDGEVDRAVALDILAPTIGGSLRSGQDEVRSPAGLAPGPIVGPCH